MRWFAFVLLALFSVQLTGPVVCITRCTDYPLPSSQCCEGKDRSACAISAPEKNSIHTTLPSDLPENCCTPCCAMPMFCCFVEDMHSIDFTLAPVAVKATIPSNNGRPVSGYLSDCWQPPERIS